MTQDTLLDEHPPAQRVDLSIWRRIYRYAAAYPRLIAGVGGFGMLVAAVEVSFPLVTRGIVDEVAEHGRGAALAPWAAAHVALTCTLALSVCIFVRLAGRLRARVAHDIRRDGFANLQRLSFSYYDRRPVGWLMSRMTADCDRLSIILASGTLDLVWGCAMMLGVSAAMFWLEWRLALVVLAVVPLLVALSLVFQRRLLGSARKVRSTNSRLTAAYNEGIAGVVTTRLYGRQATGAREFGDLAGEMFGHATRNARLSALYQPLVVSLGSLALGLALAFGGVQVADGAISLGTLVGFLAFAQVFFEPVRELSAWFAEMQMAQASAERVLGLIETVPEVGESPRVIARRARLARLGGPEPDQADDGHPQRVGVLRFENVTFAYAGGPPILEQFNLEIAPGETVALVGPTGGGKSTLVSLLARFYDPTVGRITSGGVDLRERSLSWLRSRVGIVLQTPHLFSGTLADNLRFGRPSASDEQMEAASRRVGLHPLVCARPEGYGIEVGEDGGRLSAGERQLASLVRALLADPELLILDEATSSIDPETEARLQRGVETLLAQRTCVVVAHRLSTIRGADRILVIEAGRIVEEGDHAELLELGGRYRELYLRQSLDSALRSAENWDATE
jgi:ATP-binding cassette, subfamily B, bacterial